MTHARSEPPFLREQGGALAVEVSEMFWKRLGNGMRYIPEWENGTTKYGPRRSGANFQLRLIKGLTAGLSCLCACCQDTSLV